jgi:hypothetical protein
MSRYTDDSEGQLDALLREPAPELSDDGFSHQVLAALPPRPRWSRSSLCIAAASAGSVGALATTLLSEPGRATWSPLFAAMRSLLAALGQPVVLCAAALALASTAYALRFRPKWPRLA